MCGILAAVGEPLTIDQQRQLTLNVALLKHRGPDNLHSVTDDEHFLGHTRLSIVDTSSAAHQPYVFEDLSLVFNGEIFNYVELKAELEASGYAFDTHSDTEVLIKLLHRDGVAALNQLNGMWALALYNRRTGEFLLSRDRFGQKPLFIAQRGTALVAASELQAFEGLVEFLPNTLAIASFLREGEFDVGGHTFFEGIFEFPKAAYLRWRRGQGFEVQTYWDYPAERTVVADRDLTTEFHTLLTDAVAIRLRTDVSYALLLSGGCDSTVVAGITRECVGPQAELHAFTYSSGDRDDEAPYARRVAEGLNLQLAVERRGSTERYIDRLRRLVRNMGRGHSSPAIVPVDELYAGMQRLGYKVALDGQGADEMLAGYRHYHFHLGLDLIWRGKFREAFAVFRDMRREGWLGIAIMALRSSAPPVLRRIMRRVYGYEGLFAAAADKPLGAAEFQVRRAPYRAKSLLNRYLHRQHDKGLPNLLYYGDVAAMANSIESRAPFLDHRLVELAFSTGASLKVRGAVDKAVLRCHPAYLRFREVLERRKIGFASAIHLSTREQMIEDLRRSPILEWPIFERRALGDFLADGRAKSIKFERFLFRLYQVHLWQELFTGAGRLYPKVQSAAKSEFVETPA